MSYSRQCRRLALGYDFTIGLPDIFGGPQTIVLPIEKLAEDAGILAIKAGFPVALDELNKAMPDLLKRATDIARPIVRKEIDLALVKAKNMGNKTVDTASSRAGMMVGALILAAFGAAYFMRRKP